MLRCRQCRAHLALCCRGVQPGPPGTRAAIYGIWSDAEREENPPSGE